MIGNMKGEELEAILETIPIEFSVLDKNDEVLVWNKHETRIFKRPEAALSRNVRKCHPPKSLPKVEQILSEMKAEKRDKAGFWIDLPTEEGGEKHKILIRYFVLRNKNEEYIGCLEASQDITDIQKITGEKRLLD
jgi:PAS domain S-box-containing protein